MSTAPKSKSELREALKREQRSQHRTNLIKEALTVMIAEQAIDAAPEAPPAPAAPAPVAAPAPAQPGAQAPGEPMATVDTMIEKLNVIRGGNSFSEPEVYGELTKWWKTLSPEQQSILDDQLNQIGVISSVAEPETDQQVPAAAPAQPAVAPAPTPAPTAIPSASSELPVTPT